MEEPDLRFLRSLRNVGEANKFLLMASGMEDPAGGSVTFERMEKLYYSTPTQGYLIPIGEVAASLEFLRFIRFREGELRITPLGRSFISRNLDATYELSSQQSDMLVRYLLFGRQSPSFHMEDLILQLSFNRPKKRYEWPLKERGRPRIDLNFQLFLHGLKFLGFEGQDYLYVDPAYNELLARKIRILRWTDSDDPVPSEEVLTRSRHAEELVKDYEIERLESQGREELSPEIEVVSDYDSSIGFDLLSFDGAESQAGNHDRFIEVKSSMGRRVRFVFTGNEMRTARRLRRQYFIYFVGNHDLGKQIEDCVLRKYSDPAQALFDTAAFRVDARKFRVTRLGEES